MKIFTKDFWKKLFWLKCPMCKEKKKWFYYTWEFPMRKECKQFDEVCQECALKKNDE